MRYVLRFIGLGGMLIGLGGMAEGEMPLGLTILTVSAICLGIESLWEDIEIDRKNNKRSCIGDQSNGNRPYFLH